MHLSERDIFSRNPTLLSLSHSLSSRITCFHYQDAIDSISQNDKSNHGTPSINEIIIFKNWNSKEKFSLNGLI